ncbi:MAG: hypothetical protein OSB08_03800 [SAR324 cluster bacterium]|nr:hypothetical protein [SAR324 cluster bacterium]
MPKEVSTVSNRYCRDRFSLLSYLSGFGLISTQECTQIADVAGCR